MKWSFLTLSLLSTGLLAVSFGLGLAIDDPAAGDAGAQGRVGLHMLCGLGSLMLAAMVHALVLTYFMGTGRWLEETCKAYALDEGWIRENRALKHRTIPGMVLCLLLLVGVGALGAAADPASAVGFQGWGSLDAATIHLLSAVVTLAVNVLVNLWEFFALARNGKVIAEVMREVRRIRQERDLPV